MKRTIYTIGLAAVLLLGFQPAAQAASAKTVSGNSYFCVGVIVGLVNGYVPGVRPIMDNFSFSEDFFSMGIFTMNGLNDASGTYSMGR